MARGKASGRKGHRVGTPAAVALQRAEVLFTVHEYDHDPAAPSYGTEAADAMRVVPERVFKTLVVELDGTLVVAVVPVSGSLDLKALAAAAGGKRAAMADTAAAERATGYVVGGISPIGQKRRLRTVVDGSALDHETVFVSAGRRGLELELDPAALVAVTSAEVAPVGR